MKLSTAPGRSSSHSFGCCALSRVASAIAGASSMLLSMACSGEVGVDDSLAGPSGRSDDSSADIHGSTGASTESSSSVSVNANPPDAGGADDVSSAVPGGGSSAVPDDDPQAPVDPADTQAIPANFGLTMMRRLSNREYNNTIADLLGTELTPARDFLKETAHGFDNIANTLGMTAAQYNAYFAAAADVARDVFSDPALRAPFDDCDNREPECLATMISDFGLRAFRRPMQPAEVQTYVQVYERATALELTHADAMQQMLRALLVSPAFLYRMEFDAEPMSTVPHPVNGYELASRLSYFLWSTMPDAALLAAAAAGELNSPAQVSEQVERMLAAPRASALVDSFAWQWLGMESLASHAVLSDAFPSWDEPLRQAMLGEARQYLSSFILGDLDWQEFLTADLHFANRRLADHLGITSDGLSDDLVQHDGDTSSRVGFIGTAGFLTVSSFAHRTSPTLRAKWVLEELLCSPPPPPPADLMVADLDAQDAANEAASIDNVRERLELHRSEPTCASCHSYLDPLGLALENFDAVGRYRTTYSDGDEIDAEGELPDGTVLTGLPDLAELLGNDERFLGCTVKKLFTYAMGRAPSADDVAQIADIEKRWRSGTVTMPHLIQHLVASVVFTQRQPSPTQESN